MTNGKQLIKETFNHVFERHDYHESTIRQYFHPDYIQCVDGKTLNFDQFLTHIKVLKDALASMSVSFTTLVQEDDIVFSNHTVTSVTTEGRNGSVQVIAEFHISDNKIIYCNELTHQLSGDPQDKDLASRH